MGESLLGNDHWKIDMLIEGSSICTHTEFMIATALAIIYRSSLYEMNKFYIQIFYIQIFN